MGLLTRALAIPERRSDIVVGPTSIKNWLGTITQFDSTGTIVNNESANSIVAFHAANRVIAEGVGSLPIHTYKRLPKGRELATDFYLYELLHDQPNPEMTSIEFVETLTGHLSPYGRAFAESVRDNGHQPTALWPLRPDRMVIRRQKPGAELDFMYFLPNGERVALRQDQVFRLHGLGFDGITGYGLVELHRRMLGLTIAAEEYGARYFANDASPGVVLLVPAGVDLKEKGLKNLSESWSANHSGFTNAHRTAILEDGITAEKIGFSPKDSQLNDLRQMQKSEIATMFRVPPHMIGDVQRSTSWGTGIEQQTLGFIREALIPWIRRWEQAIRRDLITTPYKKSHFVKFNFGGLLRGDSAARAAFYHVMRMDGVFNADDIRELEDLNPLTDGKGQAYLLPMNMVPSDQIAVQAVAALIRAGFEPAAALEALGMDPITHTGAAPVTLQADDGRALVGPDVMRDVQAIYAMANGGNQNGRQPEPVTREDDDA